MDPLIAVTRGPDESRIIYIVEFHLAGGSLVGETMCGRRWVTTSWTIRAPIFAPAESRMSDPARGREAARRWMTFEDSQAVTGHMTSI